MFSFVSFRKLLKWQAFDKRQRRLWAFSRTISEAKALVFFPPAKELFKEIDFHAWRSTDARGGKWIQPAFEITIGTFWEFILGCGAPPSEECFNIYLFPFSGVKPSDSPQKSFQLNQFRIQNICVKRVRGRSIWEAELFAFRLVWQSNCYKIIDWHFRIIGFENTKAPNELQLIWKVQIDSAASAPTFVPFKRKWMCVIKAERH